MLRIGTCPSKVKSFFRPLQRNFANRPAWGHFWRLVMAICVCHGATLDRLMRAMRSPCHRTKHGEFLWKSDFDQAWVVQAIALDTLRRLYRKDGGPLYFIIDETQTIKRAKKMQGVGKLYHHATRRFCTGHTMLKVCLHYRGVALPWGCWLYVKKEDCPRLKINFATLTDLAAEATAVAVDVFLDFPLDRRLERPPGAVAEDVIEDRDCCQTKLKCVTVHEAYPFLSRVGRLVNRCSRFTEGTPLLFKRQPSTTFGYSSDSSASGKEKARSLHWSRMTCTPRHGTWWRIT